MSRIYFIIVYFFTLFSCQKEEIKLVKQIQSPNNTLQVEFLLTNEAEPAYRITKGSQVIIDTSKLGFDLKEVPSLKEYFTILNTSTKSFSEKWNPIWGEDSEIDNSYNELKVELQETSKLNRKLNVIFRLYDDGLGFRYEFPEQEQMKEVVIMQENTQFNLTGDHTAWWIPADYHSYEYLFTKSKISEINAKKVGYEERPDRFVANMKATNTPLTMKVSDSLFLSIHEADLTNYSDMTLAVKSGDILQSELVPWANGDKVRISTPFHTPWRTIQIADKAGDLITSNLIVNLNEPTTYKNIDYIDPMKYTGVWWEMHVGKSSWSYNKSVTGWSNKGKHGANTKNVLNYIEFNKREGFKGLLVEGWNEGWEFWGSGDHIDFFDYEKPNSDFNIDLILNKAKESNVSLIGHHETSGDAENYDKRLEGAMKYYNSKGIQAVKTGYAGPILSPKGEYHHGQWMVNHHQKVIETAAKYNITIDAHETLKATGKRRTYPNMMTRECVRGMEYNAWGGGNPPEHTTILPFTRMLAGPIDYTPGIFDIKFDRYRKDQYVRTTLAKQLALYVVIYSPLQMVADLPENYRNQPALQFIKDVAVDWDKSIVLNGEIGEYVTIARKEKGKDNWFVGGITNRTTRDMNISFDFLDGGKYEATIYRDAPDANWEVNPTAVSINTVEVEKNTHLPIHLAPGGGYAISIRKK
ncbi:alpha-glucosidase [Flavobacteriaceae bacterium UJ101]|nr:alpha-glucosidase [Flavobacteriaceae bacterium UJ101]